MTRSALPALLALLLLSACAIPLGNSAPQPSQGAVAACSHRADQMFLQQNRGAIYQADRYDSSQKDSPYGGSYLAGTSSGLSDQYARNQDLRACLNGATTPMDSQPAATAAP